jgi:SAM-dependent methyltransferase
MGEQEPLTSCPVCHAPLRRWAVKRHSSGASYAIDRCRECGYALVNPRPSMQFLTELYSLREEEAASVPPSLDSIVAAEMADPNSTIDARRMIATIARLTARKSSEPRRLLDVGSGYGFFTREALANGFEVVAIDLGRHERQITARMSGVEPVATAFEDLDLAPSSLSVVLMSQILEHARDVEAWVSKARRLLESGGILAIALPNFASLQRFLLQRNDPYICPPDHLNFFSPWNLSALVERNGFAVEQVQHVSRLPRATLARRLPGIAAPLKAPLWLVGSAVLKVADLMHAGSVINVYCRKLAS